MDKDLKVSVVIPAFNAVETVINSIESALNQTVPVYEVIVVDDGSTDDTLFVLESYKKRNNIQCLKIFSQTNGGPAKARNKGVELSEGDWIAFLDSDDAWLPIKNERQLEVITKLNNCSILGAQFFDSRKMTHYTNDCKRVFFKKLLFKNYFLTSTVMVKRDLFTVFAFDESRGQIGTEDYKLWLQILFKYDGYVLNEGLVIYADNQSVFNRNALSANLSKMQRGQLKVFRFLFDSKMITAFLFFVVVLISVIKYFRRIVIAKYNKYAQ